MIGRPTLYTTEIAERILQEMSDGCSLREVCDSEGMPAYGTVRQWEMDDREGFAARCKRAREIGNAKTGRPTLYTAEAADRILDELMGGRALVDVCKDDGIPAYGTVRQWEMDDREGFAARCKRAREIGNARTGRSTLYSVAVADRILHELMAGRTLTDVCNEPGMPADSTVRLWVKENREGFAARYRQAREIGYDTIADQILTIADNDRKDVIEHRRENGEITLAPNAVSVSRSRLRCNMRRWMLSKMLPRIYGNKLDLNAGQEGRDTLAELLKAIDGTTRGLPNQGLVVNLPDPSEDDDDD